MKISERWVGGFMRRYLNEKPSQEIQKRRKETAALETCKMHVSAFFAEKDSEFLEGENYAIAHKRNKEVVRNNEINGIKFSFTKKCPRDGKKSCTK